MAWMRSHCVKHMLIQPCRPMQNGYIERFTGKFRDECLNEQWFGTLQRCDHPSAFGVGTTTRSSPTAASDASHWASLLSHIASAQATQFNLHQSLRKSITREIPDFLSLIGLEERGGKSITAFRWYHRLSTLRNDGTFDGIFYSKK